MTSAQKTQFITMVVVVGIILAGLIFMTKQIASSTTTGANDPGGTAQIENPKDVFMSNCETGAVGAVNCGCLTARLEQAGYSSDDQWQSLLTAVSNATASPQTAAMPTAYAQAVNACRS